MTVHHVRVRLWTVEWKRINVFLSLLHCPLYILLCQSTKTSLSAQSSVVTSLREIHFRPYTRNTHTKVHIFSHHHPAIQSCNEHALTIPRATNWFTQQPCPSFLWWSGDDRTSLWVKSRRTVNTPVRLEDSLSHTIETWVRSLLWFAHIYLLNLLKLLCPTAHWQVIM